MSEPVFINGRAKLDYCYQCQEHKAAIKHSQSIKDPIYCVLMSGATESGPAEAYAEYDRHRFVITESKYKADIEAERRWFESFGEQL